MFAEIGAQSIRGARVLQVVNGEERDFLLGSWRSQLVGAAQARVSLRMHGAAVQPTVMWQTTWEFRGTLFWAPYKNGSYYLGYHIRIPFFGNSHMFHIGDREAVVQ